MNLEEFDQKHFAQMRMYYVLEETKAMYQESEWPIIEQIVYTFPPNIFSYQEGKTLIETIGKIYIDRRIMLKSACIDIPMTFKNFLNDSEKTVMHPYFGNGSPKNVIILDKNPFFRSHYSDPEIKEVTIKSELCWMEIFRNDVEFNNDLLQLRAPIWKYERRIYPSLILDRFFKNPHVERIKSANEDKLVEYLNNKYLDIPVRQPWRGLTYKNKDYPISEVIRGLGKAWDMHTNFRIANSKKHFLLVTIVIYQIFIQYYGCNGLCPYLVDMILNHLDFREEYDYYQNQETGKKRPYNRNKRMDGYIHCVGIVPSLDLENISLSHSQQIRMIKGVRNSFNKIINSRQ